MAKPRSIREAREALGLSIRAVAAELGMSHQTLARLERGENTPHRQQARDLYEYYERRVPICAIYDPDFLDEEPGRCGKPQR